VSATATRPVSGEPTVHLAFKLWLEHEGKAFGRGPAQLLRSVDETHSLRQAAASLGMSYNKAWWNIRTMERRLGVRLLERSIGGSSGGGSVLTPEGRDVLRRFSSLEEEAATVLAALFEKHFGDSPLLADDISPAARARPRG
jgi:molybdate transport system regulatory protein